MKLILKYIINIIKDNIVKTLMIISIIGSSFLIANLKPVSDSDYFIIKFTDKDKICYVVPTSKNDYTVKIFDSNPVETKNLIKYERTSDLIVLYIMILVISSIVLFIGSLPIDDEFGWNLSEILYDTKLEFVKCDFEDGFYYYHYKNKLLIRDKYDNVGENQLIEKLRRLNLCPEYKGTKSQQRDKKLSNILS